MSETLAMSEAMLRELYERQQLSVAEMAVVLSCKPSVLRKKMAEWGIQPRSRSEAMRIRRAKEPERLVYIPQSELKHFYETLGWTAAQIAAYYGCSAGTVLNRLRRSGVVLSPPGRPVVEIPRSELAVLYLDQKLSLRQIAGHFGCDHSTIKNKLEEYGLPQRNYAEANRIYPRRDFDGREADKAYLIGFRLGDLYVTTMGETGQTIVVECATTKQEQLDLIVSLFGSYGHIYVGNPKRRGDIGITCYLNMSFAFLLPNEDAVPEWVQSNGIASTAFAAGYIDAEGSFFISQGIAHFAISSYDGGILNWLYQWMSSAAILCPRPRIVGRQGALRPNGAVYRKDLWALAVNRKASLLRLIELLEPCLKHPKRRRDMHTARLNIEARNAQRLSKTHSHDTNDS
jgi:hypothetical protein